MPLKEQHAKFCLPYSPSQKRHLLETLGKWSRLTPSTNHCLFRAMLRFVSRLTFGVLSGEGDKIQKASLADKCQAEHNIAVSDFHTWHFCFLRSLVFSDLWTEVPNCSQNKTMKKIEKKSKLKTLTIFPEDITLMGRLAAHSIMFKASHK